MIKGQYTDGQLRGQAGKICDPNSRENWEGGQGWILSTRGCEAGEQPDPQGSRYQKRLLPVRKLGRGRGCKRVGSVPKAHAAPVSAGAFSSAGGVPSPTIALQKTVSCPTHLKLPTMKG